MKATVLLIEDSRLLRTVNERALLKAGYSVVTAGDGEEALRLARSRIPDIILLDMLLPKLGGEQVLQELKRDQQTCPVPVIVLSSLPQSNETKLRHEGAVAYVTKSVLTSGNGQGTNAVVEIVERTLRELEREKQTANTG
jgi:CheY-like chemotaxis protein